MASTQRNVRITADRNTNFPFVDVVAINSALSLDVSCTGENAVLYTFLISGDTGQIEPGTTKNLISTSDPVADFIEFTFVGAASIEVTYVGGSPSTGGGATAANQQIIIDMLNGTLPSVFFAKVESPDFKVYTTAGVKTADVAQSYTLFFQGTGGKLNGIEVPDKFAATFGASMRNTVSGITFEVPTVPDLNGNQNVLVAYVKI